MFQEQYAEYIAAQNSTAKTSTNQEDIQKDKQGVSFMNVMYNGMSSVFGGFGGYPG
jgi:hypothetical protein